MITIHCQCGETYHAEAQHEGKNIKCRKCGNILLIRKFVAPPPAQRSTEVIQEKKKSTSVGSQRKSEPNVKKWWQKHLYSLIGVVIIWGIILLFIFHGIKSQTKLSDVASPQPAQTASPPKPQKEYSYIPDSPVEPIKPKRLHNGSSPFGPGIRRGHSTLTVDNGTDTDAFIQVMKLMDKELSVRNFYIQSNSKWTEKRLPPGQYVLSVAFGKDWISKSRKQALTFPERDHIFNFRRSFSRTEPFEITETTSVRQTEEGQSTETQFTNMSITLHKVPLGNFKSHRISEEEFMKTLSGFTGE